MDLTDLADIFTVSSPNIVRKNLEISAQAVKPFWRYSCAKCRGVRSALSTCLCSACQEVFISQATIRPIEEIFLPYALSMMGYRLVV